MYDTEYPLNPSSTYERFCGALRYERARARARVCVCVCVCVCVSV